MEYCDIFGSANVVMSTCVGHPFPGCTIEVGSA
jgi:hypothetical protein